MSGGLTPSTAPGALASASPGCISRLCSVCALPSLCDALPFGLERHLAHLSTSHGPSPDAPHPDARGRSGACSCRGVRSAEERRGGQRATSCLCPDRPLQSPESLPGTAECRACPLLMAQPASSSMPRSVQFLPPSLHPAPALLGEVILPGSFEMSLPLEALRSRPRQLVSSGFP